MSCIATANLFSRTDEIIDVSADPLQETFLASPIIHHVDGYTWRISPKARYRIAARVLSRAPYNVGWQSMVSPMDLALGWGQLADRRADRWISWSQSGRWYYYHWLADSPFPPQIIGSHSSNVHIIPASEQVRMALQYVRKNDFVLLEGLLVNVDGSNGRQMYGWRTSLSRDDTGDGACEILYLEKVVLNGVDYQQLKTAENTADTIALRK